MEKNPDKLKSLLSNKHVTRIGGKGTCRRKKKNTRRNHRINTEETKLKKYIDETNKKILALNEENYTKLRDFLDDLVKDYMNDLKRDDINKSSGVRYADINKYGSGFIYKNFFYPVNETKLLLKSDIYKFIDKTFKESGKKLFYKFVQSIDEIMVKKEYNINLESEKYIKEQFNKSLEYFKIDNDQKIHFRQIREKYREYVDQVGEDEEKKNLCNIHFTILRSQYNEYLKAI